MSNDASREAAWDQAAFIELFLKWNRRLNLIARGDEAVLASRHIDDSLQLIPLMPPGITRAIDLGSGGGFPGLVLALATGVTFELIESDQRKAAFLREAAQRLSAPARVHPVRIEAAQLEPAPLITARALAPLDLLLELAVPKLAPDGCCLFLKGARAAAELTAAEARWHMRVERFPSRTAPDATILRISEIERVPNRA